MPARIRNIIPKYSRVTNLPTHKTILKIGKGSYRPDHDLFYETDARGTPIRILKSIVCFQIKELQCLVVENVFETE